MINESRLPQVQKTLLAPYDLDPERLSAIFALIKEHNVTYADIYFQHIRSEAWGLEESIVKTGSFNIDQGFGVRAISGEKTAFAYSDDISISALNDAALAVRAISKVGQNKSRKTATKKKGLEAAYYASLDPLITLGPKAKVELLERLEAFARQEDSRVIQVMANISGTYEEILIIDSNGNIDADIRPLVRLSVTAIVEQNGQREQGSSGGGGRTDYLFFTDEILKHYAKEAVRQAVVNLDARPTPAGPMTVVLGSGWPGILLHEAVGHGLEGDFNRKGSSIFSGRLGKRVAAKGVTIVDDGTIPQQRGSLNIDDEGYPAQRTTLIEDGILQGYMQDRLNARLMKKKPTGNGRRESFAHLPLPRMTNTLMLAGDKTTEEIIRSVKKGIYAVNFGGGQVDITNGKFVFSMSEAYFIKNGQVTTPVKGATLIGSGPEAMQRVSMIGNDLAFDSGVGTCGKDGQSVPVSVGQPTLRIDGLTVGGTI